MTLSTGNKINVKLHNLVSKKPSAKAETIAEKPVVTDCGNAGIVKLRTLISQTPPALLNLTKLQFLALKAHEGTCCSKETTREALLHRGPPSQEEIVREAASSSQRLASIERLRLRNIPIPNEDSHEASDGTCILDRFTQDVSDKVKSKLKFHEISSLMGRAAKHASFISAKINMPIAPPKISALIIETAKEEHESMGKLQEEDFVEEPLMIQPRNRSLDEENMVSTHLKKGFTSSETNATYRQIAKEEEETETQTLLNTELETLITAENFVNRIADDLFNEIVDDLNKIEETRNKRVISALLDDMTSRIARSTPTLPVVKE